ncbi:MAG: hypothetical protein WD225_04770 [Ilumatobacteraceae bacterium]
MASNVNFVAGGAAVANSVVVKVGEAADGTGAVCLFSDADTELVVDVGGWFPVGSEYQPVQPARLLDTRSASAVPGGSSVELPVAGRAGVGADAAAVVLNVTALDAVMPGFVTVWPCGQDRPMASNVNFVAGGAAVANSVVVKVGEAADGTGAVCLFSDADTELVVDVGGWFPVGSEYQPVQPARLLDTRSDGPSSGGGGNGPGSGDDGGGSVPSVGGDGFVESFDGNGGRDRFRSGVFHRDVDANGAEMGPRGASTWTGDHAHAGDVSGDECGSPDTQRLIDKVDRSDAVYVCREHLMTSMGNVDGYSIVWFSPDATFSDHDTVAWDVNSTYLGERQWVEVMVVPADGPDLTCVEGIPCDVPSYPSDAVVVGIAGPWGSGVRVNGSDAETTWQPLCGGDYPLDPEGCASKPIRRSWSLTDEGDGTMTLRFLDNAWRITGSFPDEPWKVVFKDHNYTPDKDGPVAGHTWHWDNIAITER